MPTNTTSHKPTSSTADVHAQLAASSSATIYVDAEALDDAAVAAFLHGDEPLHVEFDEVRQKWAVRKATPEEVMDAEATSTAGAGTSSPVAGLTTTEPPGPGAATGATTGAPKAR